MIDDEEIEIIQAMREKTDTMLVGYGATPNGRDMELQVRVDDDSPMIPNRAHAKLSESYYRLENTEPVTVDNENLVFYRPADDHDYRQQWVFESDEEWVELHLSTMWYDSESSYEPPTDEIEIDDFWHRLDEEELMHGLRTQLKEEMRKQLSTRYSVDERDLMRSLKRKLKSEMRKQLSTDDPEADE
jgi:hypothetical protein